MTTAPQDPTAELFAEICKDFGQPCNPAKIRALIAAGARVDATDKNGATPLIRCADWSKDDETVQILIDAKSPLEAKDINQLTALVSAAWHGRTGMALALIKAGAKTDEKDMDGNSALLLALNSRHAEIGRALIENGADVDAAGFKENMTPLMMAVIHHLPEAAEMLLAKGCKIDTVRQNEFHDTALSLAQEMGSPLAATIQQEIFRRAEADEQRRRDAEAKRQDMLNTMACDMHTGTQQPVAIKTLRFKTPVRSFLRL